MAERAKHWTERVVGVLRLVVGAMLAGVLLAAGGLAVVAGKVRPGDPLPSYGALVLTASVLLAMAIVPRQLAASDARRIATEDNPFRAWRARGGLTLPEQVARRDLLYLAFFRSTLVAAALAEGAVLLNLVAWLLAREWWSLAAAGVALSAMLTVLPTRGRVERWIDRYGADVPRDAAAPRFRG